MQKRAVCPTPLHLIRFPALALLLHPLSTLFEDDILKRLSVFQSVLLWLLVPEYLLPPHADSNAPAALPTSTPWRALTRTTVCPTFTRTRGRGLRPLLGRVNMQQTSTMVVSLHHASFTDCLSRRYGQSLVQLDPAAEAKLRRKIDMMIVPTVALLYLFCFIDRANIGKSSMYHRKNPYLCLVH